MIKLHDVWRKRLPAVGTWFSLEVIDHDTLLVTMTHHINRIARHLPANPELSEKGGIGSPLCLLIGLGFKPTIACLALCCYP